MTERIVLHFNGRDNSAGDSVNRFREALSAAPFFRAALGSTNEFHVTEFGSPQTDETGKPYNLFALEGRLPEKTR